MLKVEFWIVNLELRIDQPHMVDHAYTLKSVMVTLLLGHIGMQIV